MSDLDDLEHEARNMGFFGEPSGVRPPRTRSHSPQCEAMGLTSRCQFSARYTRDGRPVCKVHRSADYPLTYCKPKKATT